MFVCVMIVSVVLIIVNESEAVRALKLRIRNAVHSMYTTASSYVNTVKTVCVSVMQLMYAYVRCYAAAVLQHTFEAVYTLYTSTTRVLHHVYRHYIQPMYAYIQYRCLPVITRCATYACDFLIRQLRIPALTQ